MALWELKTQLLILSGCIVLTSLVVVLVRVILRAVLFEPGWPSGRVKLPWRFSLLAIAALITLASCVFAILRDSPPAAIVAALAVLLLWIPIVRFLEFRRGVADRRKRELENTLAAKQADLAEQAKKV